MTGDEIRQLREARGWSQRRLGDFLGIEQATVSRLEGGQWEASGPVLRLLTILNEQPVDPNELPVSQPEAAA
jgi:transcriptional regulator with XRE-family HTH domain